MRTDLSRLIDKVALRRSVVDDSDANTSGAEPTAHTTNYNRPVQVSGEVPLRFAGEDPAIRDHYHRTNKRDQRPHNQEASVEASVPKFEMKFAILSLCRRMKNNV